MMILLILFAFIAGIVTILSPCILPVLPFVLSGSLSGGKRRPFGIILGFIFSFTLFTLFLTVIARLTGLSANILRNIAILVMFVFGLSLLIPQFQAWMEKFFFKIASSTPSSNGQTGFLGGIVMGISLGLLWTPCVGPILATIITLAASGSVSATTFAITLAYAVGTALPMLAITAGGRQLLTNNPWLLKNSAKLQRAFGALMVLTSMAMYANLDRQFQTYFLQVFPSYGAGLTKLEDNPLVSNAIHQLTGKPIDRSNQGKPMFTATDTNTAPDFIAGGSWFNTSAGSQVLHLKDLRGKVVLVDFWTYTCINCIRTLPYVKNWWAKYKDKGLVIVGVHTPEFAFEHETSNVAQAIKDFGITYPVMQDNNYATWNAYNNSYWPADYLIDKNGVIRDTHFGEGAYDETEQKIQDLLKENGATISGKPNNPITEINAQTPESYLGFQRIEFNASPEEVTPDLSRSYSVPKQMPSNMFAFGGAWTIGADRAMPGDGKSTLVSHFNAGNVYLVMRPKTPGTKGKVTVFLDGVAIPANAAGDDVKDGVVTVDEERLYNLVKLNSPGDHVLELHYQDNSLEVYAFTFG